MNNKPTTHVNPHGGSFWNIAGFALMLLAVSATSLSATSNYIYHEATTNNPGCGTDNYRSVLVPVANQALTIAFKAEYSTYHNQARVYYTTDGSTPAGAFGTGSGTTQVLVGTFSCTFDVGNIVDVVTATIPGQPYGTTVKYIVSAWHSGGGDEIFGNGCGDCGSPNNSSALATVFSYTLPQVGASMNFDGVDDYVDNGNMNFLNGSSAFTVEAWVRRTTNTINFPNIFSKSVPTGPLGWQANSINIGGWTAGNAGIYARVAGNSDAFGYNSTDNLLPLNTWAHVAVVYNGSGTTNADRLKIYVNGVSVSLTFFGTIPATAPVVDANATTGFILNSPHIWQGDMDELRVWNTARTCDEISQLRNCELTGNEDNLVAYYNFNQGLANEDNSGLTTLTDAAGGDNNGTLINFALTGSTSNWVAPGGVTTGTSCSAVTAPEIDVKGNSVSIPDGSTTPSTANHTDFGNVAVDGSLVRTFTVLNTGNANLTVSSITTSNSLFAVSAISATPISGPSGTATFTVTFSPLATGVENATITIYNNDCDEAAYDFVVTGNGAVPAAALHFDGVNDYISTSNNTTLDLSTQTVELWAKPSGSGGDNDLLVGKRNYNASSNNDVRWSIHFQNGNQGLYFFSPAGTAIWTYTFTPNQWYHIAMVTDATSTKLYIDGTFISSMATTINPPTNLPVLFGASAPNYEVFPGSLDEVRIWNTARNCDEINQLRNCELTGSETGLVAYYKFNQGFANENNNGSTTLTDATSNGNNGTLTNFALVGSTSNWVAPGGVTTGTSCSALVPVAFSACPTGETVNTVTGTCAAPASYTATANADITYLFTGTTTGSGAGTGSGSTFNRGTTTVTLTATNACASTATCQFSVQVSDAEAPAITCPPTANLNTNNNLCTSTASIGTASATDNCTITLNNALHFDGGNDYAAATVPGTFLGSNPLTIEFWAKNNSAFAFPMDFGATWQLQFGGGNFYLSGFGLGAFNTGATVSTSGTVWEHFALTYDGAGTWKAYKNGLPTPTPSCTMAACFNNYSSILTNPSLRMGVGNNNYFYAGGLDEVRIWSVERTQSQIAANLYNELGGMETGLKAYYKFNQGTAGGNNTGITAATATTGNNAPLNNLNLNGATSNFVAGPSIQAIITNDAAAALPKGTTTVTWTATDGSGNTNSCQQTVNVTDNQIPVLTAPSNQSVNVTAGTCTGDYTIADPISDNCTGSTWSATFSGNANGNPTDLSNIADGMGSGPITFQKGTTTVVLSGADEASNAAITKTFTVTVVDNEVPTISGCPANQNFDVAAGTCLADYSIPAPTLADNCPGTLTWSATFSGNTLGNPANLTAQTDGVASSDVSFTKGATTVTLSATDAAGNTSTANCTFTVTVTDNEAPSLTCIPDVTVNTADGLCTAGALPTPTVSDNCDGGYLGNALHLDGTNDYVAINTGSNTLSGTFTVEFWVKPDAVVAHKSLISNWGSGGTGFDIQLNATGLHGDIGNGTTWMTTAADATFSYTGGQWIHIAYVVTPTGFTIYINGVQNNSSTYSGTPLAFSPSRLLLLGSHGGNTLNFNGAFDELRIWNTARTGSEIQANMDSELAAQSGLVLVYHFNQGTPGGNNAGLTTAFDASGNGYNGTLNNFALNGATSNWVAYESLGGGLTVTNDAPPLSQGTTTTVTWTVSDDAGNSSTCQQNVTVEDNELPVLTAPSNLSVNVTPGACTGDYTIADPIFDNCTGSTWSATFSGNALGNPTDISNIADGTGSGPITFQKGTTTVILSGTDAVSNAATTVSFTVTVVDNEVPTISGCAVSDQNFNIVPSTCAHDYSIPGPTTLTDNCPGTLTWNATFSGNPNGNPTNLTGQTIGVASGNISFTRGVTTVTLSASDISGNTSTNNCTFTVTVIDDEVPSITCAADVTINTTTGLCTGTTTLTNPTVSDNCGGVGTPAAPFSASDPNLKLWIDATTFSTTNGGSLAGIIEDNSAANRALTTTATFETSGMNGKPVMRYNNNLTSVNTPFTSTNNTYLFMSVELVAFGGSWGAIFTHAPHDNGLQLEQNGLKTSNTFHWQTANDNNNVEQTIAYGTPYIMACKLENGNQRSFTLYKKDANGNLQNLGTASSSCCTATLSSSYIYLGKSASNEYVNMRMGEFIYFQNALPATEASIVGYLSAKWLGAGLSNNAPAAFAKGTTTVLWTATDPSGNTATCNQTVTVEDNELPVLTVPAANVNVNVTPGACTGDYTIADPIFDNCTGSTWSATFSGNALGNPTDISNIADGTGSGPITFQKGATTVVLSGVDAVSNVASTVSFTVTVVDNEVPTISGCSATDQNFNVVPGTCAHDYSIPGPTTLTDNCPGTLTWNATFSGNPNGNPTNLTGQTIGVASGNISFTRGVTTVTLSASDISGNTSTANCTFTVTVIDDEVPSITCAADVTINTTTGLCTGTTTLTNPTVTDNCGGTLGNALHYAANDDEVTAPATGLPTGNSARTVEFWVKISNTLQNHIVSWGNFTCAIYPVGGVMRPHLWGSNNDVSASTLSVPLNQWTHVAYVLTGTQIIFYVNGIPEAKNYMHNTASGGNLYIGSYFGATNETVDEVRIWNTVRTQVEIQNNMGAELVGNETGLVSYYKFNQGTANGNNAGITTLTATTGQNGTLSGFALNGTASNFVPGLTYPTFTSNAPATYAKGLNTVTWIATDASGNTSTCAQTVTVVDNQAPVLTAPSNQTLSTAAGVCTQTYTIADPISDNCTGSTWSATFSGNANGNPTDLSNIADGTGSGAVTFQKGTTTVTLSGVDAASNAATTKTFTVTVNDNEVPTISGCATNQSFNIVPGTCAAPYSIPAPTTLADNCPGPLTWSAAFSGNSNGNPTNLTAQTDGAASGDISFTRGVTTVTLSATDVSGNTSTNNCTFTVTVIDDEVPSITCAADVTINTTTGLCTGTTTLTDPTVTDNCPLNFGTGNGLDFDGSNDHVEVAHTSALSISTQLTLEAWIYPRVVSGERSVLIKGTSDACQNYGLFVRGGKLAFVSSAQCGWSGEGSNATIMANTWQHIAATVSGGTLKLYVNGILKNTISGINIGATNAGVLWLGKSNLNPFSGAMDDVRIWNVARTDAEILANMNSELVGNESGLVEYLKFNQGAAGGTNTGLTTATATTGTSGTLNGFALTGATSNWVSGAVTGTPPVNNAPATYPKGTTTVIWTVADASGNTSTCAQTVTVVDNELPVLTAPSNQNLSAAAGVCTQTYTIADPISDNCTGSTWSATFSGNANGNPTDISNIADGTGSAAIGFQKGTTTVTLTGVDASGNTAVTKVFTVTVADNIVPIVNACFGTNIAAFGQATGNSITQGSNSVYQSFTAPQTGVITSIQIQLGGGASGLTLQVGSGTACGGTVLGSKSFNGVSGFQTITFDTPIPVTGGVQYNFGILGNHTAGWATVGSYAGGQFYYNGCPGSPAFPNSDLVFTINMNYVPPISLYVVPGTCAQNYSIPAPTISDNCTGPLTWNATFSGNPNGNPSNLTGLADGVPTSALSFSKGATRVVLNAVDVAGNISTTACPFTVTVIDDEVPGITCASDVTINTNSGLCTGTTTLTNPTVTDNCPLSLVGNALNFDGTNDYVTIPNESSFDFTNAMTVEVWAKLNPSSTNLLTLISKGDDSWRLHRFANQNKIQFGTSGLSNTDLSSATSVSDGNWHHIAAVFTGTQKLIYIDGNLDASTTVTGTIGNSAYQVAFGENLQTTGRYYNGSLDEVRIWSTARTQAQIQANMNLELSTGAGLVAAYHFNQGIAAGSNAGVTSATDASGNNLNGTLNNFALSGATSNWVAGPPLGLSNNAPATYAKGSNTVTWTITDASGNTASCAQMVTVVDNELPVLTAPSNQNLSATAGTCSQTYNIADPISDNCTGSTWSASFSGNTNGNPTDISNINDGTGSGAVTFQKGTTTVTLSGVDAASNAAATVMFTVTVTDDERPTISGCASNQTLSTATGTCAQDYSIPAPTLADNCAGPLTWSAVFSGNSNGNPTNLTAQTDGAASANVSFQKGATTVTLSATDAVGNTSTVTCSFTVTVNDDEEPGIICADDVTINTTTGLCTGTTTLINPAVTDNCIFPAVTGNALAFDGTDDAVVTAAYVGTSLTGDLTMECWFKGSDLNGRTLFGRGYQQEFDLTLWSNKLSYYHGNGSTWVDLIFSYTFSSNTWYHIAVVRNTTVQTVSLYVNGAFQQTLSYGTPLPVAQTAAFRIGARAAGQSFIGSIDEVRFWTVARTAGEIAANWDQELAAQSGLFGLYHLNEGTANATNAGVTTAADASGTGLNGTLSNFALTGTTSNWVTGYVLTTSGVPTSNAPATYTKGSNTVTWTVADASGNTSTCAQMVTVVDNELPVLTAPLNQTLSAAAGACSQTYTIADPISDNCTGSTWSASFSGNTNGNPTDLSDIADGTGSGAVTFQKGTTTVTLSGVDAASNAAATVMFTVTVTDDERPTISGCATNETLSTATGTCAQNYSIPAPALADNCGGPLTWSAVFSGNSNGNPTDLTAQADGAASANVSFQKGATLVTLSATDAAGNTSTVTCSFTVTVNDDEEPGITCADDVTINTTTGLCTGTTTLTNPAVSDNCTGIGTPTNNAPATYAKGSNTVTWTVADASGNTSTCAQMVTVLDNELSTTTGCPSSQNLFTKINSCTQDYSIPAPTISDNCTGPFIWHATFSGNTNGNPTDLTGQTDGVASGNISFQKGTTTVTLSSTDVSGNVSTANCSFTVTVTDNVPPVVPTLSQINAICASTPTAPTTTDNCAGTVTGTTGTTFPITALGITTITWTFDDGNGNTSTATQTVSLVCDTDHDGYNPPEDCDDSNPDINPGILEDCGLVGVMGVDDDCDGTTDEDLTDPVAVCQPLAVALNAAGMVVLGDSDMDNGSSDNCVASGNLTFATSPNSFDCDDAGPNTVTLTVSDPSGNSSACTAVVTVIDVLNYTETPGIRTASDGLANDKFGWGLGFDGGVMIVGAPDDKIGNQNKQGSAYVFLQNLPSANNWGQLKQLKSSDGIAVDYFGNAISVHGSTAVIGSHGSNVGALTDAGSVYVFEQNHPTLNNWGERKRISAPDAAAYAYFGNAVSLLGERAVIGASKHKQGSNSAQGAAYIFEKNTGGTNNWGNVKKLIAADGAPNNFFGNSVTQIGDLVLVGANGNSNNRGAAYLFGKNTGGSGNWGQAQKLTASDAAVGDGFGTSVSMTSDYALIGAPNKATYSGAAYIFKNNAGTWSQLKKITVADGAINDRLGTSVELEGDYAYISAVRTSGNAGAVYVFHKNVGGPDNWGQIGKYTATNGASGDQIGYSLGVSGEMLAFGANLDDIAAKADQGSVFVLRGEDCGEMSKPSNALVSVADQSGLSPNVQCTPNPFTDELSIMVSAFGATHLTVTDAAGRLMAEADLPAGNVRFDLKTNEFRAGIYFVQVSSEAGVRVVPVALVR